jgi:hypothetical protein
MNYTANQKADMKILKALPGASTELYGIMLTSRRRQDLRRVFRGGLAKEAMSGTYKTG